MSETPTPSPPGSTRSARSTLAMIAAVLGWSLFFVVPVLFSLMLSHGIEGGPGTYDSTPIIVTMVVCGVISVVSAIFGAIFGRTKTRVACVVLLCLQAYPLVERNSFLF